MTVRPDPAAARARLVARVRKLIATAKDEAATVHERATAAGKAAALIADNHITQLELDPTPHAGRDVDLTRPIDQVPIRVDYRPGKRLQVDLGPVRFRLKL